LHVGIVFGASENKAAANAKANHAAANADRRVA
jgi:hypothetical protein